MPVDEIADRNELTVDELEKCLPEKCTVPEEVLVASLNDFLGSLRENEPNIFMQDGRGAFCLKIGNNRSQVSDADRVEAVRGFVEKQKVGVPEKGLSHAQPLPHSEGVAGDLVVFPVGKADFFENSVDFRV